MAYYKQIQDGVLVGIGVGYIGGINIEITEEEYKDRLNMIQEKDRLVNSVYSGEMSIEDVPAEWREEIQQRVEEIRKIEAEEEATEADYLAALEELGVTVNEEG